MNASTIVIAVVIAGLLALAVRRLVRRGACSACEQSGSCAAAGTHCPGRVPGQTDRTTVVSLGMPGGLTRAPAGVVPDGGSCCSAPRVADDHAAAPGSTMAATAAR